MCIRDRSLFCEKCKNSYEKEFLQFEYKNHCKDVKLSREEKAKHAALAKEKKCITVCYDLQGVLPNPCDNVFVVYGGCQF